MMSGNLRYLFSCDIIFIQEFAISFCSWMKIGSSGDSKELIGKFGYDIGGTPIVLNRKSFHYLVGNP